jgi:hypothetical protein
MYVSIKKEQPKFGFTRRLNLSQNNRHGTNTVAVFFFSSMTILTIKSELLASKSNTHNQLFRDGIKHKGCYYWFETLTMMDECLKHHSDDLSVFEDKGEDSLCMKYKHLCAIKNVFTDQFSRKSNKIILTAQEWCDMWFRGEERGFSTRVYGELIEKRFTREEIIYWMRTSYNDSMISLRALIEAKENHLFPLVLKWTDYEPCLWLNKLVPSNHHLSKNIGQWAVFTNPKYGYQHFPFKLCYLEKKIDGVVVYHGENQLTLPDGVRINPASVRIVPLKQAAQLYQSSIQSTHWSNLKEWGGACRTKLWNPNSIDARSIFNPEINADTWNTLIIPLANHIEASEEFQSVKPQFDFVVQKRLLKEHLDLLKSLDVKEFTFRKKYVEISDDRTSLIELRRCKERIWKPRNLQNQSGTIKEIESLEPMVVYVDADKEDHTLFNDWNILRLYSHTADYDKPPARGLRFLVVDRISGKYLGVFLIASDVISIGGRDSFIGWTAANRTKDHKLNNSAIGACIMGTQPFSTNFLGTGLIAALLTTKSVRDIWKERYRDVLVGFTTTSLFGKPSVYDGVREYWRGCPSSKGTMSLIPDDRIYSLWKHWLADNRNPSYEKIIEKENGTGEKQKIIKLILKEAGLRAKDYAHGFPRGVYYAGVYENFKEFLQNKIKETDLVLKQNFATDVQGVLDWWKPKAIKRYIGLHDKDKLNPSILFYDRIKKSEKLSIPYDKARSIYLTDVGR